MKRRNFIKSFAAALVLPKLPVVREVNPDYVTAPYEAVRLAFDPAHYNGEWVWMTFGANGVINTFPYVAPEEPS